jgi:HEAT repeat protein
VKEVLSSRTYDGARLPAEALSYVNDPVAIPYLQRAFDTPYPIQSLLADALEKIGTDDSIRALLAVSRSKPDVARDAVKQALANLIIRTSDPELKKEISEALKDRT